MTTPNDPQQPSPWAQPPGPGYGGGQPQGRPPQGPPPQGRPPQGPPPQGRPPQGRPPQGPPPGPPPHGRPPQGRPPQGPPPQGRPPQERFPQGPPQERFPQGPPPQAPRHRVPSPDAPGIGNPPQRQPDYGQPPRPPAPEQRPADLPPRYAPEQPAPGQAAQNRPRSAAEATGVTDVGDVGERPAPAHVGAPAGEQAAPRRGPGMRSWLVVLGALLVIAALVALSAFVWPGWVGKTLSQSSVQDGVQRVLTDQDSATGYGLNDVKDVSCPSGMKAEAGETFTCLVSVDGQNKRVTVTVTDDDGTYEVSAPTD